MKRVVLSLIVAATPALADTDASVEGSSGAATPEDLDLRLTLSSFLYRETGDDVAPFVVDGSRVENASPVKRYFGDLRIELTDDGLALDARVRQTTSQRFQSGADGTSEYELRALAYRFGGARTSLTLGRQYIDSVGATKIDGLAVHRRLGDPIGATLFVGLFPALGSRSIDTDYPRFVQSDGAEGPRLLPVTGGLGIDYHHGDYHGAIGVAGVYIAQNLPDATSDEKSRVFTTSTGYWRPVSVVDLYHFVLLDVAGQNGVALTNGSAGLVLRPVPVVQVSASVTHVGIDVLQIATRNLFEDPDPAVDGLVRNDVSLVRVSQDAARAGASLALAAQRFEVSASAGVHRRPAVTVPLSGTGGDLTFSETRSIDATFGILDRRSSAGLRISLSGTLAFPFGSAVPNRARSTSARLAIGRAFARDRGQLDVDAMGGRFSTSGSTDMCVTFTDVFDCYSATKATVAQAGVIASWRIGREWLLVADTHAGYRDATSQTIAGSTVWPHVYSITSFVRAQWRYH